MFSKRIAQPSIRNGRRQLVGAYVVSIQGRPVFTVEQANLALTIAFDASATGDPVEFVFAPVSRSDAVDFRRPPLYLQLSQLKRIHALRTVSREGDSASVSATVSALEDAYTDADLFETICQIRGDEVDGAGTHELVHHIRDEATPEEEALGTLTRRMLKQLSIWDLWLASEWKQLDAHQKQKQNVFGAPCPAPHGATVLRSHWIYNIKPVCGTIKARMCCDGSKRAAPELRFAQTYASCIDQPCMRLFYACLLPWVSS
jgi:hypothetical protein